MRRSPLHVNRFLLFTQRNDFTQKRARRPWTACKGKVRSGRPAGRPGHARGLQNRLGYSLFFWANLDPKMLRNAMTSKVLQAFWTIFLRRTCRPGQRGRPASASLSRPPILGVSSGPDPTERFLLFTQRNSFTQKDALRTCKGDADEWPVGGPPGLAGRRPGLQNRLGDSPSSGQIWIPKCSEML